MGEDQFSWFESFGSVLENATVKDISLLEAKGIVPSNSGVVFGVGKYDPVYYEEVFFDINNAEKTNKIFWYGVKPSIRPSYPVPRRRTNSFTYSNVLRFSNQLIFSCECPDGKIHSYLIPKSEEKFIQTIGDKNVDR